MVPHPRRAEVKRARSGVAADGRSLPGRVAIAAPVARPAPSIADATSAQETAVGAPVSGPPRRVGPTPAVRRSPGPAPEVAEFRTSFILPMIPAASPFDPPAASIAVAVPPGRAGRAPRQRIPMSTQTPAETELAELLVESLNLDGVAAPDIDPDAPLFGAGLGLDSIDALELALAISKKYGFQLRSDSDENRRIFASLRALSEHVQAQRTA